jgi:cytochrome c oxidase cbb3-type subunit 3
MTENDIDEATGVSTTGHEWDGIKELNNPLPRWWVWTFYMTIVWAIGYTVAYPAWPLVSTATSGLLGYSSRTDVKNELATAEAAKSDYVTAISEKSVEEILADERLRTFAAAAGAAKFKVNCVQCHGSGAEGSKGFPNLNDDDWLWGGKIGDIQLTIAHGARFSGDDNTRVSEMPAFKDMLEPAQISEVSSYTASLSGLDADPAKAVAGKPIFEQNCAVCHGEDAKGNRELGAPDLTDAITLYVNSEADIESQVRSPKHGAMPAWDARLGGVSVKELAVYVHSLGGGE